MGNLLGDQRRKASTATDCHSYNMTISELGSLTLASKGENKVYTHSGSLPHNSYGAM